MCLAQQTERRCNGMLECNTLSIIRKRWSFISDWFCAMNEDVFFFILTQFRTIEIIMRDTNPVLRFTEFCAQTLDRHTFAHLISFSIRSLKQIVLIDKTND